jgi:hypothetical protein
MVVPANGIAVASDRDRICHAGVHERPRAKHTDAAKEKFGRPILDAPETAGPTPVNLHSK